MRFFEVANDKVCYWVVATNQDEALEMAVLALNFDVDESAWVSEQWHMELEPKGEYELNMRLTMDEFLGDKGTGYFLDKRISYNKDYYTYQFKKFSIRNYYLNLAIKQAGKDIKLANKNKEKL